MPVEARILSPAAHLARVAADVSRQAAELVRAAHGTAVAAGTKSTPTDVVTRTDLESEQLIRAELMARCPGSSIVGEELDDHAGGNALGWIVDPIDGTVNFLYALPVVSVSIAATLGGVVVAGAVTDVIGGDTFSATRGEGAWRNGRTISVSNQDDLASALVGTGFAYDASIRAEQAVALTRLLPACRDIRCMGSAALNLCWVGCGLLDGYFERDIKLYDYAAGALIAEEAGATMRLPTDSSDLTVCATPSVFDSLHQLVAA